MVNEVEACSIVEQLAAMKFFPADPGARVAIMRMLMRVCHSFERGQWLSDRMIDLFKEWPGPAELRAVYSSKWRPADGLEGNSGNYIDGIPSEKEQRIGIEAAAEQNRISDRKVLMLESSEMHDLPAGEPQSANPELAKMVEIAAKVTKMRMPAKIDPNDPVIQKLIGMGFYL